MIKTVEEKAKAYDEALKQIKECTPDENGFITIYPQEIFPELVESEDERIRKGLIQYFSTFSLDTFAGLEPKKIIAWLEKQVEQKPVDKIEPKFKIGDTVTVKPMSCHGKVFKGKPFKIVDIIEDNYVSDDGKTYSISLQDGWELVEQKPAWSEEDEHWRQKAIDFMKHPDLIKATPTLAKNTIEWLKSLKVRVQPKQEWSEEDEKMFRDLHNLIYVVRDCDCDSKEKLKLSDWIESLKGRYQSKQEREWSKEDEKCIRLSTDIIDSALRAGFCVQLDRDRCVDWLKSLRHQSHWKPSDAQMASITCAVRNIKESTCYDSELVSLFNDLKKLKG